MRSHNQKNRRYSPRATLAAVGVKIGSLKLLDQIKRKVVILQKSVRHAPAQKLTDAFIAVLAGANGLAEFNTRVRSDEALQRAFGRNSCADQSVVQETLGRLHGSERPARDNCLQEFLLISQRLPNRQFSRRSRRHKAG